MCKSLKGGKLLVYPTPMSQIKVFGVVDSTRTCLRLLCKEWDASVAEEKLGVGIGPKMCGEGWR